MSSGAKQNKPASEEVRKSMRCVPQAAHGEPAVWLAGGGLAVTVLMILGMVGLIVYQGGRAFWPDRVASITSLDGSSLLGKVQSNSVVPPEEEGVGTNRVLVRTENFKWNGSHAQWVSVDSTARFEYPENIVIAEMLDEGRVLGTPDQFLIDGELIASDPAEVWNKYLENKSQVHNRHKEITGLRRGELAENNARQEKGRLQMRRVELKYGTGSGEHISAQAEYETLKTHMAGELVALNNRIVELQEINDRYQIGFTFHDGTRIARSMADIVRLVPVNRMTVGGKLSVYFERWWEFLSAEPRHANSQGGIWPALFGTVVMTLIMSIMVVPFGVLAALYLNEYAKPGFFVSSVRIAVNNLAGVPSIVFGVFGLSFFCYIVGAKVDDLLFAESLPNPTFGKGGILWASLTLALLTLPVVIVATEEALAAVPGSMREGSYGCGATRWQTIRRVVLPRAMPGIMTGMILAIARGAGEVAPLMLVGAVKMTQDLPVDLTQAPYLFPQRSFMHLGFHIYDLGFQSQDSEAARPMVFATTLLLIGIVVGLNLGAIWIRARLRKRFRSTR
ncbi:MAG: phosphate ABC transporter permease PstA [bacterium]|nr:phosphate ABC transporter permease PstA [bacterium]